MEKELSSDQKQEQGEILDELSTKQSLLDENEESQQAIHLPVHTSRTSIRNITPPDRLMYCDTLGMSSSRARDMKQTTNYLVNVSLEFCIIVT